MGKYATDGITWTEVATLMEGLQGIHECTCELTITTGGQGHNGGLTITVLAWVPVVEPHQTEEVGKVIRLFPNRTNPTMESAIFSALYELDRVIGKHYEQKAFK